MRAVVAERPNAANGLADGGVPIADLLAVVRPPARESRAFRERGWWRDETLLHDLFRGSAEHPERTAVIAYRAAGGRTLRLSYAQLATYVERFAYALRALGLGPGDPVAFQLPNWWETTALFLACLRLGAVAVPILASYGARDLETVLTAAQPRACVVADVWEGVPQAEGLAEIAGRLPWLRRRVVLGDAAATGALDFTEFFVKTPHERRPAEGRLPFPVPGPGEADRICLVVSTLGLREKHGMFMHSANTLHAGVGPETREGSGGVEYSALPFGLLPSLLHTVVGPLTGGGTAVLQDVWDPGAALDLFEQVGVTRVHALPGQWSELLAEQRRRARELPSLRHAISTDPVGTSTRLVREVQEELHTALHVSRGSAEAGGGTTASGLETDLVPVPAEDGVFRLRVRGPSTCLAVWQSTTGGLRPTWDFDGGWLETDGLVGVADEGPVRLVHQQAQEVGGLLLVPVADVEHELVTHERVADAALVAYPDPEYGELPCAVVVPRGDPPDLSELRQFLTDRGVAAGHLPARLELVGALPRDELGEVRRAQLRDRLARRWTGR